MITGVQLRNYRNHVATDLRELPGLAVFVGPNGAGKSAVLEAVHLSHHAALEPRSGDAHQALLERCRFDCNGGHVTVWGSSYQLDFGLEVPGQQVTSSCVVEGIPLTNESAGKLDNLRRAATGVRRFRLEPSRLSECSYPRNLPTQLADNGYGLASVLSGLARERPDRFAALLAQLRIVVPAIVGVRSRHAYVRQVFPDGDGQQHTHEVVGDELLFDTADGQGIPGESASVGTLLVLAILTLAHASEPPTVLLLDDIETGLHPAAQRELMRALKALTGDGKELQIILTTHSPYVLDDLSPDQIWVFGRNAKKEVQVKRLSEHPNAKEALNVLTTGEFWSTEGESWVGSES